MGRHLKCPTCRASNNLSELTYVYGDQLQEAGGDRGAGLGVSGEDELEQVKGSYSTKIVALVRALKRLQDGEKALVFSEWEDMLGLLSHALEKNGIQHLRCKGAKAISKGLAIFKKDPEMRAVLLPFKSGCAGLNVVEATHVFLIEPLLNVAVEAQAIGRVHRIGQVKPTTVHRMIVEETVEERVRDLGSQKMAALNHGLGASVEEARATAKNKETVTLEDMKQLFQHAPAVPSPRSSPEGEDGGGGEGGEAGGGRSSSTSEEHEAWWNDAVLWQSNDPVLCQGHAACAGAPTSSAPSSAPGAGSLTRRQALHRLLRELAAQAAERRMHQAAAGGAGSAPAAQPSRSSYLPLGETPRARIVEVHGRQMAETVAAMLLALPLAPRAEAVD